MKLDIEIPSSRGLIARFFDWAFRPVRMSPEAVARLEHAAKDGSLVFVMRSGSALSAFILGVVLKAAGLPALRYASHLQLMFWQPWRVLFKRFFASRAERDALTPSWQDLLFRDRPPDERRWQAQTVAEGQSSVLFLLRARTATGGNVHLGNQALERVVQAQRALERPVYVVPLSLFFEQRPENFRRSLIDFFFGPRSGPGRLRELGLFLLHRHETQITVGELIDLKAFIAERSRAREPEGQAPASGAVTDGGLASELRAAVYDALQLQTRLMRGPRLRTHSQVASSVLRDPDLRATLIAEAAAQGKSLTEITLAARKLLREIAADYRDYYVTVYRRILDWVFEKIYDGVSVDEVGFERLREATKHSTLVVTPSHKSHADYLILSYVFHQRGMQCPHIAAGINLSFWPLGRMFRGAGAFFVRRSFKGNVLYSAVFKAYVKRLVLDRFAVEFFPEGTRSRSGRLLPPKMGMFKYVVEAWRTEGAPDITVVPVSLDYEKIIEQASYQAEMAGGEKKRESFGALLGTGKVLRSRYGRVYVHFGEPLRLSRFAGERAKITTKEKCGESEVAELARALGFQVMHDIGRAVTVTPSAVCASVVLNHRGPPLSRRDFHQRCERFLAELKWLSAPLAPGFANVKQAVDEALARFVYEKRLRLEAAPDGERIHLEADARVALAYYQNTIATHVVDHAIVAAALLAHDRPTTRLLQASAQELSRLLKHEFSFRADKPYEQLFGQALSELSAEGIVRIDSEASARRVDSEASAKRVDSEASVKPADNEPGPQGERIIVSGDRERLVELRGFLDATIGAYLAVIDVLPELLEFPLWEKEVVTKGVERAKAWVATGRLLTPESVQRSLMQNAVQWLKDLKVLSSADGKAISVLAPYDTLDALQAFKARFVRYLPEVAEVRPQPASITRSRTLRRAAAKSAPRGANS